MVHARMATHRLSAAITIHDAVFGGVLCSLLATVPGGDVPAVTCRRSASAKAARSEPTWYRRGTS